MKLSTDKIPCTEKKGWTSPICSFKMESVLERLERETINIHIYIYKERTILI